jgi:glucose-6-phosphate 1-dehydrogenase
MNEIPKPALEPAIIVIFGITGDLAKRKLLPALYHLFKDDLLHEHTVVVGVTRRDITTDELLADVELCVNETDGICDPAGVRKLRERLRMLTMDVTAHDEYDRLLKELNAIEDTHGMCMNRLYYLSIPPQVYSPIVRLLGTHGLNKSCQHGTAGSRILVEKPFGYDLKSAGELIAETSKYFSEDQIFRIDHYLAKETVQNILAFRFNNPIFESIWNADHIASVQITATEKLGIEGRKVFYEQTGAMRDLIQSHLLQLLAVVAMGKPLSMDQAGIHAEKLATLRAVMPPAEDQADSMAVRGQYEGYRTEVDKPDSNIETYAALLLYMNTERWRDVPFLIRTGKSLAQKQTDIRVVFKKEIESGQQNILTFRIQPDEGIGLSLMVKKPGYESQVEEAPMDFSYERSFTDAHGHPDAYERVLVDAVRGDHTLFATGEEVLASWRIIEPILRAWLQSDKGLEIYQPGSEGPAPAAMLAENAGTPWQRS